MEEVCIIDKLKGDMLSTSCIGVKVNKRCIKSRLRNLPFIDISSGVFKSQGNQGLKVQQAVKH